MVLLTAVARFFTALLLTHCRGILTQRNFLEIATTTTMENTETRQKIFRMFLEYQENTMVERLGTKVGQDLLHSNIVVYDGSAYLPSQRK